MGPKSLMGLQKKIAKLANETKTDMQRTGNGQYPSRASEKTYKQTYKINI